MRDRVGGGGRLVRRGEAQVPVSPSPCVWLGDRSSGQGGRRGDKGSWDDPGNLGLLCESVRRGGGCGTGWGHTVQGGQVRADKVRGRGPGTCDLDDRFG